MEQKKLIVRVADIIFGIMYRYDVTPAVCRDYEVCGGEPAFWISVTDEEIAYEQEKAEVAISPEWAEVTAISRKLAAAVIPYDAFLFHAALIEYEGVGYAFSAKSGVGKSTHIGLWREVFGETVRVINGDKPIVRFADGKVYAYGTPWCGKERYNINDKCELKNICFIERAEKNAIRAITATEAVPRILPQILLYKDGQMNLALLGLVDRLCSDVKFYVLGCTPEKEAALVARAGMCSRKEDRK